MKCKLKIKTEQMTVCPVCSNNDIYTLLRGRDFESGTGLYNIDVCKTCGIHFTNPRPSPECVSALYEYRNTADFIKSGGLTEYLRRISVQRDLNHILSFADENLSILDFGCGDGFFSLQLSRHLKCHKIAATDFHEKPPHYLERERAIQYYSYQEYENLSESYDIIFCRNVLEHVLNPVVTIEEMRAKLKAGGLLVLEIPNYESVWRIIFGKYYSPLYLPRHLFHFNEKDSYNILKDFEKIMIFKTHSPVLGRSLGYLLGNSLQNTGIIGLLLFPFQILVDFLAGTSSMLRIIAQVPSCPNKLGTD